MVRASAPISKDAPASVPVMSFVAGTRTRYVAPTTRPYELSAARLPSATTPETTTAPVWSRTWYGTESGGGRWRDQALGHRVLARDEDVARGGLAHEAHLEHVALEDGVGVDGELARVGLRPRAGEGLEDVRLADDEPLALGQPAEDLRLGDVRHARVDDGAAALEADLVRDACRQRRHLVAHAAHLRLRLREVVAAGGARLALGQEVDLEAAAAPAVRDRELRLGHAERDERVEARLRAVARERVHDRLHVVHLVQPKWSASGAARSCSRPSRRARRP